MGNCTASSLPPISSSSTLPFAFAPLGDIIGAEDESPEVVVVVVVVAAVIVAAATSRDILSEEGLMIA